MEEIKKKTSEFVAVFMCTLYSFLGEMPQEGRELISLLNIIHYLLPSCQALYRKKPL